MSKTSGCARVESESRTLAPHTTISCPTETLTSATTPTAPQVRQIKAVVDGGDAGGAGGGGSAPPLPPANVTSIDKAEMKMQVPGHDGQATWKTASFDLQSDGVLRWTSEEAWPWDAGAIDIKKALGVWLLGPPGWRRLDIILPEHRWTLAADDDAVLQKWIKLLEDLAPEKPVSEIRNGWMEKKGAVGGGWKVRFFVLLSTHELLYFESDRSPKCKGVIDLKEATGCTRVASPDYNYEFAFEVASPKRTWVLCPDDEHAMKEWMNDISALIRKPNAPKRIDKKRTSVSTMGNRQYGANEQGSVREGEEGQEPIAEEESISRSGGKLKQGWVEKRGQMNTEYKKRYCVLYAENVHREVPKTLKYYKNEDDARAGKAGHAIEIDSSCTVHKASSDDPDRPHYFEITTPQRKYSLCVASAEDLSEWVALCTPPLDDDDRDDAMSTRDASSSLVMAPSFGPTGKQLKEGYMKKRGKGLTGFSMQKRFFILFESRELRYYEAAGRPMKGRIKLNDALSVERSKPMDKRDFTFKIRERDRTWELDPMSRAAWEEWEALLRPMVEGS